jgi:hypothetical protein
MTFNSPDRRPKWNTITTVTAQKPPTRQLNGDNSKKRSAADRYNTDLQGARPTWVSL